MKCDVCEGTGMVRGDNPAIPGALSVKDCPKCKGTGRMAPPKEMAPPKDDHAGFDACDPLAGSPARHERPK